MDSSFWIESWREGRTGFHQLKVHRSLDKFWPALPAGSSVLVPLCGKSLDLLWLEQKGLEVTGIELAEQAVDEFCHENGLAFSVSHVDGRRVYRLRDRNIQLVVDDFFSFAETFDGDRFDSLYDRAALVALPAEMRKDYVTACRHLLCARPAGLLITLEYEQNLMPGPPFSVPAAEVQRLWKSALSCVDRNDVLEDLPKAKAVGVPKLDELTWVLQLQEAG